MVRCSRFNYDSTIGKKKKILVFTDYLIHGAS